MANIRKRRAGQYQARVRRQGYPDTVKTFPTRTEAREWAASVENDMRLGAYVDHTEAEQTALRDGLQRYLTEVTPLKKSSSQERRRVIVWQRHPWHFAGSRHSVALTWRGIGMRGSRRA